MVRAGTKPNHTGSSGSRETLGSGLAAIAVAQEWAVSSARESGRDGEHTIAGVEVLSAQLHTWLCAGAALGRQLGWAVVPAQWWQRREAERDAHSKTSEKQGYTHRASRE